jgi:hypothetical protein
MPKFSEYLTIALIAGIALGHFSMRQNVEAECGDEVHSFSHGR